MHVGGRDVEGLREGRLAMRMDPDPDLAQRRQLAAVGVVAVLLLVGIGVSSALGGGDKGGKDPVEASGPTSSAPATTAAGERGTTSTTTTTTTTTIPKGGPSDERELTKFRTITGRITPKSVVASGHGLVFAQNMMYSHSITVYDDGGDLEKTIPDTVDLSKFKGFSKYTGSSYKGAPVEAAFTKDGRYAYVSNYSMYGEGYGPEGSDACTVSSGTSPSTVYRVDTKDLEIDQVIAVGPVPKYDAITPDQKTLLVSNWCGDDISVVDLAKGKQVRTVDIGRHPRGIAITKDSKKAYVAVMGSTDIAVVDLTTWDVSYFRGVGSGPRHLVLSPDDKWLYVTTNRDGHVSKLDAATGEDVARASTGQLPRSLAMSTDGTALYVVNYGSDSMSKVRTDTMAVTQTLPTGHHPIGITYEPRAQRVWVANYSGSIMVFDDR